jgi:hypothetical protein
MENKKDTNLDILGKGHMLESALNRDTTKLFLLKKTQKIVSAIYLVTSLIKDIEPVRGSLRSAADELLKDTVRTVTFLSKDTELLKKIERDLLEIISFLGVAKVATLVSEMNAEILEREVLNLHQNIIDADSSSPIISSNFFTVTTAESTTISKGHEDKGQTMMSYKTAVKNMPASPPTIQKVSQKNDSGRRDLILNIVRKNIKVGIKDISSVVKDCSEKTIQRELTALVDEGVLKKEGDRRWSRYSLKG